jgi:hypothetical protein
MSGKHRDGVEFESVEFGSDAYVSPAVDFVAFAVLTLLGAAMLVVYVV